MKKYILLILATVLVATLPGQELNGKRWRVYRSYEIAYVILYGGVVFKPDETSHHDGHLQHKNTDFQYPEEYSFTLQGLPISRSDFMGLRLRESEIDSERCLYYEECQGDSLTMVHCSAMVKIPLLIDGTEYR